MSGGAVPFRPMVPRKWGVDVLAALYGLLAGVFVLASFRLPGAWKLLPIAAAGLFAFVSFGLARRIQSARRTLQTILAFSILVEFLLLAVLLLAASGAVPNRRIQDPGRRARKVVVRMAVAVWMIAYLRSPEVAREFAKD